MQNTPGPAVRASTPCWCRQCLVLQMGHISKEFPFQGDCHAFTCRYFFGPCFTDMPCHVCRVDPVGIPAAGAPFACRFMVAAKRPWYICLLFSVVVLAATL